jgi:hypothetical protein
MQTVLAISGRTTIPAVMASFQPRSFEKPPLIFLESNSACGVARDTETMQRFFCSSP